MLQRLSCELRPAHASEKLMLALTFLRELDEPHWPHTAPPIGAAWKALREFADDDLPAALGRATQLAAGLDPDELDGAFNELD